MNDETELFDRYLSKEMSEDERRDFEAKLEHNEELRKSFQLHLSILESLNKQMEKENAQFGEAMKNISEDDLQEIINMHSTPASADIASANKASASITGSSIKRIKTYWISSIAAILIVGFFGIRTMKTNYENRNDNLLVEYNAGMVSRGAEGELDALMQNVVKGNNLDATIQKLETAYNSGNSQDRPIAGWYLALAYIKQHNHDKAIATLKSLQQKYPDIDQIVDVKSLLKKLEE